MACKDCKCSKATPAAAAAAANNSAAQQTTSLPLPPRNNTSESTPLWSTQASHKASAAGTSSYGATTGTATANHDPSTSTSTSASATTATVPTCDGDAALRGGVCCRQLKDSDTRTLLDPDVVRDVIIGLSDGLTVPFALTAGLSGVGSTRLVVIAGLAELVSGAISMGVGGFLSAQAEVQHYRFMAKRTHDRVLRSCSSAVVDEVCDILGPYGVPKDIAALVANRLAGAEREPISTLDAADPQARLRRRNDEEAGLVEASAAPLSEEQDEEEHGLTPFILRVGEGLEPISASRAWQSAVTIGLSYFLGGLLPLFPYIFLKSISEALFCSVAVTAVTLLAFGVVKQRCTGGAAGWKGYAYGALSTLMVGGLAAGASWAIVRALEGGNAV